jgi:signal peptidase I
LIRTQNDEFLSWAKAFLFGFLSVWLVKSFLFVPIVVDGKSMYPTLENNDKVIVSKVTSIERFDIVVFVPPHIDEYYIKRVIGLPGDSIEIKDDILYVNGKSYKEEYVNRIKGFEKVTEDGKVKVPNGEYFVLGDNRLKSLDSRYFGFIKENSLVGEAVFRFYPFISMEKFK